mmetsp:Transcript_25520/g.19286  ORF Transcript_25520/g.19286 Transcript_25520/m.19286 type:complete len:91 (+) Transcript_25520:1218-1490(+)
MLENTKDSGKLRAEILINLIHAEFDISKSSKLGYMEREVWLRVHNHFQELMQLLSQPQIKDLLKSYQNQSNVSRSELNSVNDLNEGDLVS